MPSHGGRIAEQWKNSSDWSYVKALRMALAARTPEHQAASIRGPSHQSPAMAMGGVPSIRAVEGVVVFSTKANRHRCPRRCTG